MPPSATPSSITCASTALSRDVARAEAGRPALLHRPNMPEPLVFPRRNAGGSAGGRQLAGRDGSSAGARPALGASGVADVEARLFDSTRRRRRGSFVERLGRVRSSGPGVPDRRLAPISGRSLSASACDALPVSPAARRPRAAAVGPRCASGASSTLPPDDAPTTRVLDHRSSSRRRLQPAGSSTAFYFHLTWLWDEAVLAVWRLWRPRPGYFELLETNLAPLLLGGRLLTAVLGAATVPVAWAIGRRIGGTALGLVASTLVAASYQLVRDSHALKPDVELALGVLASVWLLARYVEAPSARRAVAAGVAIGVTTAFKYNGVLLLAPAYLAELMAPGTPVARRPSPAGWILGRPPPSRSEPIPTCCSTTDGCSDVPHRDVERVRHAPRVAAPARRGPARARRPLRTDALVRLSPRLLAAARVRPRGSVAHARGARRGAPPGRASDAAAVGGVRGPLLPRGGLVAGAARALLHADRAARAPPGGAFVVAFARAPPARWRPRAPRPRHSSSPSRSARRSTAWLPRRTRGC
jgi:hypothetical protein